MSNYTITTDFGAKDSLPSGNAAKVVKGSEFTAEFTNIQTAIATKLDLTSGSATNLTTTGTLTNSGAMTTTGVSTFNGAVNFASTTAHAGNATFSDNAKAIFGAGADLQIYHDGTDTHIVESGAGSLKIKGNFLQLLSPDNEKFFEGQANGASSLFYNGVAKLDTSNNGVDVTGQSIKLTGANPLFYLLDNTNTNTCSLQNTDGNFIYRADSGNQIGNSKHTFTIDGSNAMRIDTTGVGIGTDSPATNLHIAGGSSGTDQALFRTSSGGGGGLQIVCSDLSLANPLWSINTFYGEALAFGDGTNEHMRIDSSGNVGIGTSSPAYTLDIEATSPIIKLEDTDTNTQMLFNASSGIGGFNFEFDSTSVASAPYAAFKMSGTEAMRIDSSGKLLLNTATHTLTDSEMVVASEYSASGTTTGGITLSSRQSGSWRNSGIFANGAHLTFTTNDTGLNGAQASSERMRIDSSGNVGIGTDSPTEKLDIDGDSIRLRQSQTPASASATGSQGQIAWDANYMYVCTATDTWKRVALATW